MSQEEGMKLAFCCRCGMPMLRSGDEPLHHVRLLHGLLCWLNYSRD